MTTGLLHRGYDGGGGSYVYWTAPRWDPNGDFYDGGPSFGNLTNITVAEADVTIVRSVQEQPGAKLLDAVTSTNGSPVGGGAGQGVDISGYPTVNAYWILSDPSTTAKVKFWVWDGNVWVPDADNVKTLDNSDGRDVLNPFDLEGGFGEVYAEVTSAPANGDLTMYVTPHN